MATVRVIWNAIVTAWLMIGMMIVIFIVLDLMAAPFVYISETREREKHLEVEASQYDGAKWALDMFREEGSLFGVYLLAGWDPYVYWAALPYKGKYFSIGRNRLRRTFADPRAAGGKPFRIFMFGGSTMFGQGARDNYTIPSALEKELAKEDFHNVEVVNFGQIGYSSTQELISLLLQIRRGNVPDLVIMYDGINDTFSAFQNNRAGLTLQEYNRAREFNILNPGIASKRIALYTAAATTFVDSTAFGKILRAAIIELARPLYEHIHSRLPHNVTKIENSIAPTLANREMKRGLPRRTVEMWVENARLVEQIGKESGFKCMFYWQPLVYSKRPLSDFEKQLVRDNEMKAPGLGELITATYAHAREVTAADGEGVDLRDISDVLDEEKSCFWDPWHVTESCNAVVAARIAKDVVPILAGEARGGGHAQTRRRGLFAADNIRGIARIDWAGVR